MDEIINGQKRLNDKLMKQGAEIIKKTKCQLVLMPPIHLEERSSYCWKHFNDLAFQLLLLACRMRHWSMVMDMLLLLWMPMVLLYLTTNQLFKLVTILLGGFLWSFRKQCFMGIFICNSCFILCYSFCDSLYISPVNTSSYLNVLKGYSVQKI